MSMQVTWHKGPDKCPGPRKDGKHIWTIYTTGHRYYQHGTCLICDATYRAKRVVQKASRHD